jgi:ATP-dependent RNA helicase DDX41
MSSPKRRRIEREEDHPYNLGDNDDYVPYVPVAQRRQAQLSKLASRGTAAQSAAELKARQEQEERDAKEDKSREEENRKERLRKERTLLEEAQEVMKLKAETGTSYLLVNVGVLYLKAPLLCR